MDARPPRQPILPPPSTAQCQDQNGYVPLPMVPRLILQCDHGVHVPLMIMPGSYNSGVMASEKILVPDGSCGFGVVSFPRSYYASSFRRASSTSMADWQLRSSETRPGVSGGGQRFDRTKASLRSCDSDSASSNHTHDTMVPIVDKDGKPIAQNVLKAIVANNPAIASKYGYRQTPSGAHPDDDKKTYCSYWIRTGECDYTQQGCRYKHEMPDLETLNRIGFRDFPLWWKKRLFKRPTGLRNDALKKIMAQPSDGEDCSSDCDADSEKSLSITANAPAIVNTSKTQRAVLVNRVDISQPTPEALDLIDLEPVSPRSSERRPASAGSVIRGGKFVPYNKPRPVTSSSSSETLHPLPLSHIRSPVMPVPTVPHPTLATSPESKHVAPRKGKGRSKIVPAAEFPSLIDQRDAPTKTATSAESKNINPTDHHQQIEKLQHHQRQIEILAAGVGDPPSLLAIAKNKGLKASKHAKSSGSENISIRFDTANTEKGKTRKSRRSKRSIKARTLSPHPVSELTQCKPRKPANTTNDGSAR